MKKIRLTGKRGGFALVDDEDFEWLSQYKWNHTTLGYCARYPEKGKAILMHREIMRSPMPEIDHIDGNKRNNQKHNLRPCTRRTNATNSGKRYPKGKYGRGVAKMAGNRAKPYHVQAWDHGRNISGGYFRTLREARTAAEALRRRLGYVE